MKSLNTFFHLGTKNVASIVIRYFPKRSFFKTVISSYENKNCKTFCFQKKYLSLKTFGSEKKNLS
jgi:hypothetical protein